MKEQILNMTSVYTGVYVLEMIFENWIESWGEDWGGEVKFFQKGHSITTKNS